MFPTIPPIPLRYVAAAFSLGVGFVVLTAWPHPDVFIWNLINGLLGLTASALFTIAGLAVLLDRWRRRRWLAETAEIVIGAIDAAMHDLASLATFSLPLVGGATNEDELLRYRITSALALPFSRVRETEIDRVESQLSQRLHGLFMDEKRAKEVASASYSSAPQLEARADHFWSTVLQIYDQLGSRAQSLLTPAHQLVLTVRELADQLAFGPSVAQPIGIIKGIYASQLLSRLKSVCVELDAVYADVEALPMPDAVTSLLAERRAQAVALDEETAKEQTEEDEYERLKKDFDAFMASFDPTPEFRELNITLTEPRPSTSDEVD
jgi:hypothetical protein